VGTGIVRKDDPFQEHIIVSRRKTRILRKLMEYDFRATLVFFAGGEIEPKN
jgi:hypothetical protein